MKPFDLEKALSGAPVMTRGGSPVTQITRFDNVGPNLQVYGVAEGFVRAWNEDGTYIRHTPFHNFDLVMVPEKREGWVIVNKGNPADLMTLKIFKSQEVAMGYVHNNSKDFKAVRIEWEEE